MLGRPFSKKDTVCPCPHHKMIPTFIVLIGFVFLLEGLGVISSWSAGILWPTFLIIIGLTKLGAGACGCCKK